MRSSASTVIDAVGRELAFCRFRGVRYDRLDYVLNHGIDVEPTDATIYADYLDKALEYGGMPKLILALNPKMLQRSFREVPTSTPKEELAALADRFPTRLESEDGSKYWYSRLEEGDPKLASPYEAAYAYFVEGDPFAALEGLLVFVRPKDVREILGSFR